MSILGIVVTGLGASIAKVAMSMWLNEPDLQVDATSGIVDSLAKLTGEILASRSGNRQFEKISEHAARRIEYMYEVEFKQWSEEDFLAVLNSASDTIMNLKITPQLLAHQNLSDIELSKYLISNSRKYQVGLSTNEIAVLKRLLELSAELIIEFATQLPEFTQQTLAVILSRESTLLREVNEIAERFRVFQEESYNPVIGIDTRKFRSDYLRILSRKLGHMELYGSDLSGASRKHNLNIAYINLSLQTCQPATGNRDMILRADQAIRTSRRLFIRGAAGSGKSTLLKWIAVKAANKDFDGDLSHWNTRVPFVISLRQCVDRTLPKPSEFPSMIAPNLIDSDASRWVHDILSTGQGIVMIDGVDEISRRNEVREWIEDLVLTYPESRFIVTSRPLASSDRWQTPEGFEEAELLPMTSSDISLFVEYWHEAVENELIDRQEREGMKELAESLIAILQSNYAIRSLCSSPLLCAMVCALHKDKHRNLPNNRLELYEACTKMLVEEREIGRGVNVKKYPSFSYSEITELLSNLAYHLMLNGWSEVKHERAATNISNTLKSFSSEKKDTSPYKVLDYFVERTGMVFEPSAQTVGFIHRTFQEYLAAKAAIDQDATGILKRNALDPLWREVILLATGLANQKQKNEILEDLLSTDEYSHADRKAVDLLAVACIETVTSLNPDIRSVLENRLRQLMPPRSMVEAKTIALAGDLAVPFLTPKMCADYSVCINTLEMIGSKSALNVLVQYLVTYNTDILDEVAVALESINADTSRRQHFVDLLVGRLVCDSQPMFRAIRCLQNIDDLTLRGFDGKDLDFLRNLRNVRRITLEDCPNLVDLSSLRKLQTLRSVKVSRCNSLQNIADLGRLSNMEHLFLSECPIKSFGFISNLVNLKTLKLYGLRNLTQLPKFEIYNSHTDMTDYFEKLSEMHIVSCERLEDINSVRNSSAILGRNRSSKSSHGAMNLSKIVLGGCPKITNLNVLDDKPVLQTIEILDDGIKYRIPPNVQAKVRFVLP